MHKCMYLFGIYFYLFWILGSPQIFSKVKVGVLERLFQKFMVKLLYPLFNILLTV